jgi:histidinol dehydrogenase
MANPLNLNRFDVRQSSGREQFKQWQQQLRLQGDTVSESARQKTIEVFGDPLTPAQVVDRICRDVKERGLPAVLDYTRRIDGVSLAAGGIRVPTEMLDEAHAAAEPEFLATIGRIRERILRFQSAVLQRDVRIEDIAGGNLAHRYVPLERVGICVPGGAAAYPSTVLMTAVPAQAAGVKELAVVAPPTRFGAFNRDLLATCRELQISEVYSLGGAQAVAALAYGIEGLSHVDKIVGPGNLFVALAKKWVFGDVDIDSIAGPSEIVIIADRSANPEILAADMIAQAEHSPGSSILITWDDDLLGKTASALEVQLDPLPRGELARESLNRFGGLISVSNENEAVSLANDLAPEHLHLAVSNAEQMLKQITNAGAVFLGHSSPVAAGDYVAGPSHVLPTSGTARFASGLSANDFLRGHSVIHLTQEGLDAVADDIHIMANKEGLTAHWASVERRLNRGSPR